MLAVVRNPTVNSMICNFKHCELFLLLKQSVRLCTVTLLQFQQLQLSLPLTKKLTKNVVCQNPLMCLFGPSSKVVFSILLNVVSRWFHTKTEEIVYPGIYYNLIDCHIIHICQNPSVPI